MNTVFALQRRYFYVIVTFYLLYDILTTLMVDCLEVII